MAPPAGLPLPDFTLIAGPKKTPCVAAVQAGMDRNYAPMAGLFVEIIGRTLGAP